MGDVLLRHIGRCLGRADAAAARLYLLEQLSYGQGGASCGSGWGGLRGGCARTRDKGKCD